MTFSVSFPTRWSDFDPNNHLRHTAYNDYAAEGRVRLFSHFGLSLKEFNRLNIGPVLFREETNFIKEILLGDNIEVELWLKASSSKGERFKFHHKIYRGDGELCAEINIYAAWMDLKLRKLTAPPLVIADIFAKMDKTSDFEEIIPKAK